MNIDERERHCVIRESQLEARERALEAMRPATVAAICLWSAAAFALGFLARALA